MFSSVYSSYFGGSVSNNFINYEAISNYFTSSIKAIVRAGLPPKLHFYKLFMKSWKIVLPSRRIAFINSSQFMWLDYVFMEDKGSQNSIIYFPNDA